MSVITLTQENFENEVLKSDKPVLIDFWAEWCGPCQAFSPVVDEVADERNDIKVCKVNIDQQRQLAAKFKVMSIPTLLVIKNGEITNRSVGFISKDEIFSLI